jgi:DNA mismatch endonuclease (patch repair protein)
MAVFLCSPFLRQISGLKMYKALRACLEGGSFGSVSPKRSDMMSAVRGRHNRSTEQRLRMALVRAGVGGWTLHPADIVGHPDFWFSATGTAVFVDGCFWHGCPRCGHTPTSNRKFWAEKIKGNKRRDRRVSRLLRQQGCRVVRLWEHQISSSARKCIELVVM